MIAVKGNNRCVQVLFLCKSTVTWGQSMMKNNVKIAIASLSLLLVLVMSSCGEKSERITDGKIQYEPNWESLSRWEVPEWFDRAVLGIYCHWGVYSVPGYRFDSGPEQVDSGLWYGHFMYVPNDADEDQN